MVTEQFLYIEIDTIDIVATAVDREGIGTVRAVLDKDVVALLEGPTRVKEVQTTFVGLGHTGAHDSPLIAHVLIELTLIVVLPCSPHDIVQSAGLRIAVGLLAESEDTQTAFVGGHHGASVLADGKGGQRGREGVDAILAQRVGALGLVAVGSGERVAVVAAVHHDGDILKVVDRCEGGHAFSLSVLGVPVKAGELVGDDAVVLRFHEVHPSVFQGWENLHFRSLVVVGIVFRYEVEAEPPLALAGGVRVAKDGETQLVVGQRDDMDVFLPSDGVLTVIPFGRVEQRTVGQVELVIVEIEQISAFLSLGNATGIVGHALHVGTILQVEGDGTLHEVARLILVVGSGIPVAREVVPLSIGGRGVAIGDLARAEPIVSVVGNPRLALSDTTGEHGVELVVDKVGTELIDGEVSSVAVDIAAACVHTEEHVVGAGKRNLQRDLFLLRPALRLNPVDLIAVGHLTLQIHDVGVLVVVGDGIGLSFDEISRRDILVAEVVVIGRARCHAEEHESRPC